MSGTKGRSQTPLRSGLPSGIRGIPFPPGRGLAVWAGSTTVTSKTAIANKPLANGVVRTIRIFILLLHVVMVNVRDPGADAEHQWDIRMTWGFTLLRASAEVNRPIQYVESRLQDAGV